MKNGDAVMYVSQWKQDLCFACR